MTGEEFKLLAEGLQSSNQRLKDYLIEKKIPVAHYYYWKKKFGNKSKVETAQFMNITSKILPNQDSSEVVLEYPNGIRIRFKNYPGSKSLLELI